MSEENEPSSHTDERIFRVSDRIFEAIDNPPPPSEELKAMVRDYGRFAVDATAAKPTLQEVEADMRERLKIGDLITHTRSVGKFEEHIFTGWDGHFVCGDATEDTLRLSTRITRKTNEIVPLTITHINRESVGMPAHLRQAR